MQTLPPPLAPTALPCPLPGFPSEGWLTARCLWALIKSRPSSAASSPPPASATNAHLHETMKRGHELVLATLRAVEADPQRYPPRDFPFGLVFTWTLEAIMDLGILCEKYLVQNYVEAYQGITNKLVLQQQQQAAAAALALATPTPTITKERGGTFTKALAAVFGPNPSTPTVAPFATPPPSPSVSIAPVASSSSTLQQLTRALKVTHEADLKVLQTLRGDLYAFLLERLFQFGKAHPLHQLCGEIRDVLNQEQREHAQGIKPKHQLIRVQSGTGLKSSTNSPRAGGIPSAVTASLSGTPAPVVARIGIDDDVYLDTLAESSTYDREPSPREDFGRLTTDALAQPSNSLFEARHRRILGCFDDEPSSPAGTTSFTFSDLFLELCTCSLRMYWLSGRYRLCTRVAELKACIYYRSGDHGRALDLFLTNCDRWRKDRWTQLFYPSLTMAIKAMQHLGKHEEVVRACLLFLLTHHHHVTSSRFRPQQAATAGKEQDRFSWSRLGGLVTAKKKEDTLRGSTSSTLEAEIEIVSSGKTSSPFLAYAFPTPPTVSTPPVAATVSSSVPPVIQIVQLQREIEEVMAAALAVSFPDSEAAAATTSGCSPFLLDCCPPTTPSTSSPSATYENGCVSISHIQCLLLHTLKVHMPSVDFSSPETFEALRALAHRSAELSPVFPPLPPSIVVSPSSKKQARPSATSGVALSHTPIVIPAPFEEDSTSSATSSSSLPGGAYIESSLHPFFVFRTSLLFLYRKSHPLHGVLEVDLESRFAEVVTLDTVQIVVALQRRSSARPTERRRRKLRRQISVVVSAPPPVLVTNALSLAIGVPAGVLDLPYLPMPSPLPSQSISASASMEKLSEAMRASGGPITPGPGQGIDQPNPTPSPDPPAAASEVDSSSQEGSPDPPQLQAPPPPRPDPVTEWSCCFRRVTLQPGLNRVYFHIFHSTLEEDEEGAQVDQAASVADHEPSPSLASASTGQHYSVVLRHSFAALEQLHAIFEPSHAHMQEVVDRRRNSVLLNSSPLKGVPSSSPFSSPFALASSAAVHSYWSTSLSVRDVCFQMGRLLMWHTDLASLNAALKTHVLTPEQRRKDLLAKATIATIGRDHLAEAKEDDLAPVSLSDVDLSSPSDPHLSSSLVVPSPAFKPFVGKPRLSLDLLPISKEALLIGKTKPFDLIVQIVVAPAKTDAAAKDVERCVLHVAANSVLKLFGRGRSNRSQSDSHSSTVNGLLVHRDGVSEKKSFVVESRSGDITLGTLPGGSRLLLLIPVFSPGHMAHLLRTKQITLPSSSVTSTPYSSRPCSPTRGGKASTSATPSRHLHSSETNEQHDQDGEAATDLHSVQHPFTMDLTCSSSFCGAPTALSQSPLPSLPSFMFSTSHALTFMEPLQMRASIERLGHRWFLQFFLWNRCAFPLTILAYHLDLPRGFVLKRDPNAAAIRYVMPPLPGLAGATDEPHSSLTPGLTAATSAAAIPISHTSSNVYSMAFELAAEDPAESVDATARDENGLMNEHRRPRSQDDIEDELRLASSHASTSIGRFTLEVCTRGGSAVPSPSSLLSLSWPIDVAIMSGAQDLHLLLSFPALAHMGRLVQCTLTVLHIKGPADKRTSRGRSATPTSNKAAGQAPLHLLYTLVTSPSLWLISGKSVCSFTLAAGESKSFNIQLLPIASGYLPIPHVDLAEQVALPISTQADRGEYAAPGNSTLMQAARKLAKLEQLQSGGNSLLDVPSNHSSHATETSATGSRAGGGDSSLSFATIPIPGSRILRHFATNQQVHVYPPNTCDSQLQQVRG